MRRAPDTLKGTIGGGRSLVSGQQQARSARRARPGRKKERPRSPLLAACLDRKSRVPSTTTDGLRRYRSVGIQRNRPTFKPQPYQTEVAMIRKWPVTALPVFASAAAAAFLWPGLVLPASAAAPLSPVLNQMKGSVQAPSSLILKIHSRMHSNCANHYGKYHRHVRVPGMRTCVEWAARGSSDGRTERICTRWVTLPARGPRYKIRICPR